MEQPPPRKKVWRCENRVMYDPHTRESCGFGFVTMEPVEEVEAAVTALNATELGSSWTCPYPTPGRYYGAPKRNDRESV